MWCFYGGGVFTLLCAAAYGSFVFVCLYGVARKRWDILALIAVPFFLLLFNAFLSNNLPRFNAPAIPFMVISLVAVLQGVLQRLRTGIKKQDVNSGG
jgi:4-amino-4-deoxy-L-arabinose transferase-like glycosyltransferase